MSFRSRQPAYLIYFFSTATLGFTLLALSCHQVLDRGMDSRWIAMAGLTLLVGSFTVKIPGTNLKVSVADTFVLINMILFGPAAGCITAALEAFAGSIRSSSRSRRWEFTVFNMGNCALCAYLSGSVFFRSLGSGPLSRGPAANLAGLFPSAVVLALCYYVLNSGTVAIMVALESRKSAYRVWKENFLWHPVNYLVCTLGALLISICGDLITAPALIALGLVVLTIYSAYRIVLGRLASEVGG